MTCPPCPPTCKSLISLACPPTCPPCPPICKSLKSFNCPPLSTLFSCTPHTPLGGQGHLEGALPPIQRVLRLENYLSLWAHPTPLFVHRPDDRGDLLGDGDYAKHGGTGRHGKFPFATGLERAPATAVDSARQHGRSLHSFADTVWTPDDTC